MRCQVSHAGCPNCVLYQASLFAVMPISPFIVSVPSSTHLFAPLWIRHRHRCAADFARHATRGDQSAQGRHPPAGARVSPRHGQLRRVRADRCPPRQHRRCGGRCAPVTRRLQAPEGRSVSASMPCVNSPLPLTSCHCVLLLLWCVGGGEVIVFVLCAVCLCFCLFVCLCVRVCVCL